jgi:CelD/BcsL family acetyltransferase involved in cellulose biosynthesis
MVTRVEWLGMPVSQYGDVLSGASRPPDAALRHALYAACRDARADVLVLRKVRRCSVMAGVLDKAGARLVDVQRAPYLVTGAVRDVDAFMARYPAKSRKNRRRLLRRLEERGPVTVEHHAGGPRAVELARKAVAMKRAWLDHKGRVSHTLCMAQFEEFFARACAIEGDEAPCRVSAISLSGEVLAVLVSAVSRDRIAGHVFAYDIGHEKSGAGVLLMEAVIADAVRRGVGTLDLLAPADAYKFDWCETSVEVCDYVLPLTWRGRVYAALDAPDVRQAVRTVAEALPKPMQRLGRRAANVMTA